jgi:hypothetical protein
MRRAGPWSERIRYHLRKWAGRILSWGARLPERVNGHDCARARRDDWVTSARNAALVIAPLLTLSAARAAFC